MVAQCPIWALIIFHFLKVHRKCSRPDPIVLKGGKVTRTSLHLPSYLMLLYHMQNKNSFSCHHDVIRFCQYFSNQSGWLGEVSLHEQCRVDFTKMHPQRAPNPCSRVGLSCSILKNTSATCAYPLVSNARKLKRDKRAHACAQGTFSYTPCSRKGLTKNIYVSIYFS